MDKLEFLDGVEAPIEDVQPVEVTEPAIEPTPEPQPEAPPVEAQLRDESGRFAAKDRGEPPHGYVPVGVVNALRDEIRGLKTAMHPPAPPPDIFEDQHGFINQTVMQPLTQQISELNLNWSRRFAEQAHGADAVNEAEQWVLQQNQLDPTVGQRVISSPDPYGAAVAEYKRGQILTKLDDPARIDAFFAWEAAQKAAQASPQPAAPAAPQQSMPTRSLASAPSSGGAQHVPSGPGQAFDALFQR